MKPPTRKIVEKQIRRMAAKGKIAGLIPCVEKYWRRRERAWEKSYIRIRRIEYVADAKYNNYQIRGALPYTDEVFVCRKKARR